MIVNCPSCTTLYRYEAPAGVLAVHAQCSGCEATFDLEPTRRAFAIVADAVAEAPGAPISEAAPAAAEAGAVQATPGGAATPRGEAEHWTPPDGMKLGTFDYDPEAEQADAMTEADQSIGKSRFGEWLTALFLGSVGGGSGCYLAVLKDADLTTFIAGGSAVGLVCGWAVIRWMARES